MEKLKRWTAFSEEYPGGIIFSNRDDALEYSREQRLEGDKAYVRVQFLTQKEIDELPELD